MSKRVEEEVEEEVGRGCCRVEIFRWNRSIWLSVGSS